MIKFIVNVDLYAKANRIKIEYAVESNIFGSWDYGHFYYDVSIIKRQTLRKIRTPEEVKKIVHENCKALAKGHAHTIKVTFYGWDASRS